MRRSRGRTGIALACLAILAWHPGPDAPAAPLPDQPREGGTSGHLDVGGTKLYYEARGEGPAIVLVHDGLVHREAWDGQWGPLSEGHRVIRYDRRGYGRSEAPNQPYSDVEDLHRLLKHLNVERATIVGSSAGGSLAIEFALEHPALVERLILAGPVVGGMGYSEHMQRRNAAAFRPLSERGDVAATIANWRDDPYLTAAGSEAAKRRLGELLTANPQNLTTRRGPFQRPPSRPALGRLSEIRVPTLILVGESDIPDVHAHVGAIQAGIAGARRTVVPGAGHLIYMERPDEFNRLVLDFLAGK